MEITKLAFGALFLGALNNSMAATVLVPVTANIYGSGHSGAAATPQPAGGGGGTAPPSIDVLTATQFSFLGSGNAKFSPSNPTSTTPDGPPSDPTTFNGHNGLSGFSSDRGYALYGVFVGAIEPADPRPAALSFVGNTSFAQLSPQLDQVFYIGDGLTGAGSGSMQVFNVPVGALKLFFGLADGINNPIDNGFYGDNSGDGYLVEIYSETADFDADGDVDGADFLTWQRGIGTTAGALRGDGNANPDVDGDVDSDDLAVWRNQFGDGGVIVVATVVPESRSIALWSLAALCLICEANSHGRLTRR